MENKHTNGPFLGQLGSMSIIDHIGATPLVRLNHVPAAIGVKAQVYAKLEYFNAGGSSKDRIAKRMMEKAEQEGRIKPGDTLIEASSGNTGIAIALIAAVKGYKCIIVMSEKISLEKEQILQALGARIVRTPVGVPVDSPDHVTNTASRLQKEVPGSCILDQFANPDNPAAHEFGTAEEIWHQSEGKVDAVIAGAGTGGTLTGTARGLRKHKSGIFMVGVDPEGSVLGIPQQPIEKKTEIQVEGIGHDFVPSVLDQSAANLWIKTNDEISFRFARQLIRKEGLLCGGSAGATIAALAQLVEKHPELNTPDKVIVIIFPDGIRNYLSKFVNNEWMAENGFHVAKL